MKFGVDWPSCFREEDVENNGHIHVYSPGAGVDNHLGHVTWTIYINFRSPFPRRLYIKFGFDWSRGFIEDF